jgi:hypothetical protein
MVRSVLYLTPRQGNTAAVVDYYRRAGVLKRAEKQNGCLGAALHIPRSGSGQILVTALWQNPEAYEGWVANSGRSADANELAELVEEDLGSVRGALFEVVLAVGTS